MWGAALQMYGVLPQMYGAALTMYGAAVLLIMVQFAPHGSFLNESGIITLHNRTTGPRQVGCLRTVTGANLADMKTLGHVRESSRAQQPTNPRPLRFVSHRLAAFRG